MPDAISLQVINLDEFKKQLSALDEKVRGSNIVTALQAGALIVENAAKEKAPARSTRTLSRSIHTEVANREADNAEVDIGTDVVYAAMQEFGGVITPKRAKMLHWVDEMGTDVFANMVTIPAHPYLRPAMDENKEAVQETVAAVLKQLLGASE